MKMVLITSEGRIGTMISWFNIVELNVGHDL